MELLQLAYLDFQEKYLCVFLLHKFPFDSFQLVN